MVSGVRLPARLIVCCLAVVGFAAAPSAAQASANAPAPVISSPRTDPSTAASRQEAPGGPASVVVAGREIYRMQVSLGPFSPAERARAAGERIRALARAPQFSPDRIGVLENEGRVRIVSGGTTLFDVLADDLPDEDAAELRTTAARVARDLTAAIEFDRVSRSPKQLAIASGMTILVLLAALGLAWLVVKLTGRLSARIERGKRTILRGIHLRGLELVSANSMVAAAQKALRLLRAGVFLLLVYFAVVAVLALFPWTEPYGRAAARFVLSTLAGVVRGAFSYIPNLFMIALTVTIVQYVNRFVSFLFDAIGRGALVIPNFHPELAAPTKQISRWLIWILGLVVIFPYVPGSGTSAFRGIGVFVGLMVSLGSTGAIGNLVAGIVLIYSRAFAVGDRVKIADTIGDVVIHGLLSAKIVTIKNEEITIPNSAILGNHIVNYTELAEQHGLILHTTVTIGYDAPWRTVHDLLIEAARDTPGVLADPEPFVLQTALDDFYVRYEINAFTRDPRRMAVIYSELHQSIQDRFFAAGVEIMSPHYASLRDGNDPAIPPAQRSAAHAASRGFRVSRSDD